MSSKLESIVESKLLKILKLFLNNPDELYHLKKISDKTKVPLGSTHRLIKKLSKTKIIDTVTVGKIKLYKLNKENSKEFNTLKWN